MTSPWRCAGSFSAPPKQQQFLCGGRVKSAAKAREEEEESGTYKNNKAFEALRDVRKLQRHEQQQRDVVVGTDGDGKNDGTTGGDDVDVERVARHVIGRPDLGRRAAVVLYVSRAEDAVGRRADAPAAAQAALEGWNDIGLHHWSRAALEGWNARISDSSKRWVPNRLRERVLHANHDLREHFVTDVHDTYGRNLV